MRHYVLRDRQVVAVPVAAWTLQDIEARRVAEDRLGDAYVSTVFLGISHGCDRAGQPLLFESMVFGGAADQHQMRYTTWDAARAGHARLVEALRRGGDPGR